MLQAPFPWFGGKSRVADVVWRAFGDVPNYVEPFFGSGAVLLNRPGDEFGTETINDKDGFVSNFWRAIQHDPDAVAAAADYPVNENDLHARHAWLVSHGAELVARLEGDPDFYDAKIAGWWCWGICSWIGGGFCSGNGPWQVQDGKLVHLGDKGRGINRQRVHLGNKGQGINRRLVHLGDKGQGINRQLVHLGTKGRGVNRKQISIKEWFQALSERLRRVRVCSGDWERVCGPAPTIKIGLTGVFLDPPYSDQAGRCDDIYRQEDLSVAHRVREWCKENGNQKKLRIALCGYDGEHNELEALGWSVYAWKAAGGYGSRAGTTGRENAARERIWFSPHCLPVAEKSIQLGLFSS